MSDQSVQVDQRDQQVQVDHLPLRSLWGFNNVPAIPYWASLSKLLTTVALLGARALETEPAKLGLSVPYTIGGETHAAYDFLYGQSELADAIRALDKLLPADPDAFLESLADGTALESDTVRAAGASTPLTQLALDEPQQFAISWTTFEDVYESSKGLTPTFASWLTDSEAASKHFWPTIASFGLAYNLLILEKVGAEQHDRFKSAFGNAWNSDVEQLYASGRLYVIDLTIFDDLEPQSVDDAVRFTPGTVTLLAQDPETKALTPFAIRVCRGGAGGATQVYAKNDPAWLYALQAAKTSVTVYGIWLGHVYHWHIVTAAMQMAMFNTIPEDHPLWPLLSSQSNYLIEFDDVLLLLWGFIAPPTSIVDPKGFLGLLDRFADGRSFFDDDPTTTLERSGLREQDFTVREPWDAYPIAGLLLELWSSTEQYVETVVGELYADDTAVANDTVLQDWLGACGNPDEGNIRGLPSVQSREVLTRVLTSLLYRVTAHGVSRLNPSANPVLTFVANFPSCLQDDTLPDPDESISGQALLRMLPHTGTIGMMTTFYFTFVFSVPYVPFIPLDGVDADLYFPDGSPCNQALIKYRQDILAFIGTYFAGWQQALAGLKEATPSLPPYAESQEHQWPRNIET